MANTSTIDLVKPAGTDYALISTINGNMDKIDAEAAKERGNFAGTYSTSSAYAVGAYCIYQGNLYRCITAIGSGGEAWTAAHWDQVSVGEEITSLNGKIANYQGAKNWVSNVNCNDCTSPGIYLLAQNLTNAPYTWFTLVVLSPRDDDIQQIALKGDGKISIRSKGNSWGDWQELALKSETIQNTESFSSLSTFKTFFANMTVGKAVNIITSSEVSTAISGSTYMCSGIATKIDSSFIDINWVRGDSSVGSTRYNINSQTFIINDINSNLNALDSTALKFVMQTRSQSGQYTAQLKNGSQYLVIADRYSVTESNYACMYYVDSYQGDKHITRLTSNTGVLSNISISSDAVLSYTTAITYVRIIIIEISRG